MFRLRKKIKFFKNKWLFDIVCIKLLNCGMNYEKSCYCNGLMFRVNFDLRFFGFMVNIVNVLLYLLGLSKIVKLRNGNWELNLNVNKCLFVFILLFWLLNWNFLFVIILIRVGCIL